MSHQRDVLGYLSGPVDAREVHQKHRQGTTIDYLGTSYMREFFQICEEIALPAVVVTSHDGEEYVHEQDNLVIANYPKPTGLSGLRYHAGMFNWTRRATDFLHQRGCTHCVLTDAQDYWFVLANSPLRKAKLIPALHGALEPAFAADTFAHNVLHALNKHLFFRRFDLELLSASPLISRQLKKYSGSKEVEPALFLPLYERELFQEARQSYPAASSPFILLFAGRIIDNKGVFDLLEAVKLVTRDHGLDVHLHYAGDGPDLAELRRRILHGNLQDSVFTHGYCGKHELVSLLGSCHAVVVPSRSELTEGFAMICAEAVLAGRPLITSQVCPALELLRPAALEAEMDDVRSYAEAIVALATDPGLLAEKREATAALSASFYDPRNSYGAKLKEALVRYGIGTVE